MSALAVLEWNKLHHEPDGFDPWWAQRMVMRSPAPKVVVVAARQTGKTTVAARIVVRTMCQRPRSTSCLLMPTKKSTVGPLKQLRAALESALGPEDGLWCWRAQDAFFRLWNGAELYVRTCEAEAKEGVPVRGFTCDGILWVDEAAYVPRTSWDAARGTLLAVRDPRCLVTGTPCGKTWLYDLFQQGVPGSKTRDPGVEAFRFRATQSPFASAEWVAGERKTLGPKKALQELDAVFLGDGGSVFTDAEIERLLEHQLGKSNEIRGVQRTIGMDVGIERDFTVFTLMNEFGEAWILERFRHVDINGIVDRAEHHATEHDALCVIDIGMGGGHGGALASLLKLRLQQTSRLPSGDGRVLGIRTGNQGVKSELVVTCQTSVQNGKLQLIAGEHVETARNEFRFFEGHQKIIGGVARWTFSGPPSQPAGPSATGEGEEHDDIVLSLCLANWGREHGWDKTDDGSDGGLSKIRPRGPQGPTPTPARRHGTGLNRGRQGGYFFR